MLITIIAICATISLLAIGTAILTAVIMLNKYIELQKTMAHLETSNALLVKKLDALEMGFSTFGNILESNFEDTENKFQEVKKYMKGVWADIEGIRRELPEAPDGLPRVLN